MTNVICEVCHRPVILDGRFCGYCGSKFLNDIEALDIDVVEDSYFEKVVNYISRLRSRYGKSLTQSDEELARLYISENPIELQGKDLLTSVKRFLSVQNRGVALQGAANISDVELLDMIQGVVHKYRDRYCPHCRDDDEDLAMDIYLHFKKKGFLERFNPAVCEIHYYIWMGCRNYMIDLERKLGGVEYSSYDEEYSTPDREIKLLDPQEGVSAKQKQMLLGLIEKLDDEPLGPVVETPLGDMAPSEKSIMKLYLESYKPTEIGRFFHISRMKIKNIIDEAIAQLQQYVKGREILMADRKSRA